MDDAKIDQIAREVLTGLKNARVQERTAAASDRGPQPTPSVLHPSQQLLSVAGGVVGTPCIIEPDKLCVGSLRCRTFGH